MKNKRGWIKIAESVFGIILLASIVLLLYSKNTERPDLSEQVYSLQIKILNGIASDEGLREAVLTSTETRVNDKVIDFVKKQIPTSRFDYEIKICDLSSLGCSMSLNVIDKDVFVEERIISSSILTYSPKIIRLFIWEK